MADPLTFQNVPASHANEMEHRRQLATLLNQMAQQLVEVGYPINIQKFGAVGDGVTDDTAAFQAALDSGEQYIFIPNTGNRYMVDSLTCGTANEVNCVHLVGEGFPHFTATAGQCTEIQFTSTTDPGLTINGLGFRMENFFLSSSAARAASGSQPAGIYLNGDDNAFTFWRALFKGVYVYNQPGDAWHLFGAEQVQLINCAGTTSRRGFFLDSGGVPEVGISNYFQGCRATNNDEEGWYVESWFNTFDCCQSLNNNIGAAQLPLETREVFCDSLGNRLLNFDIEAQDLHDGTPGTDRPTYMNGIWLGMGADDCEVRGGLISGYDTGIRVRGDNVSISNVRMNGGNATMTYGIDNDDVDSVIIHQRSFAGSGVTTHVRKKVGSLITLDGQTYIDQGLRYSGAPEVITASGAISPSAGRVQIDSTSGALALTLVSPAEDGDTMFLSMTAFGGNATLTPSNLLGYTTITFTGVGDTAMLIHEGGSWAVMGGTATLA